MGLANDQSLTTEKTQSLQSAEHVSEEFKIWYFAYGSNMSTEKFQGSRGIIPHAKVAIRATNWHMSMLIPGLPYQEPAFSAIERVDDATGEEGGLPPVHGVGLPPVHGVAYLITQRQYRQVIASEGGGTAYTNVMLFAEPLLPSDQHLYGDTLYVHSLGPGMSRKPSGSPSKRYMDLVVEGAREAKLPAAYLQYLNDFPRYTPPQTGFSHVGREIFLFIFNPVFAALEKLTKSNIQDTGFAPEWIICVVRTVVLFMWAIHDLVFAPIFGRGDGRDQIDH